MANQIQKYLVKETRLGIPAMIHEEACSGFTAIGATTFPQTIGIASSFEPKLSKKIGRVIVRHMIGIILIRDRLKVLWNNMKVREMP